MTPEPTPCPTCGGNPTQPDETHICNLDHDAPDFPFRYCSTKGCTWTEAEDAAERTVTLRRDDVLWALGHLTAPETDACHARIREAVGL